MPIHNKKYYFAMSSFVRVHGHSIINNPNIKQFCLEWSESGVSAPLTGLDEVDQYFYLKYKSWESR
jgi:hypothetical protein